MKNTNENIYLEPSKKKNEKKVNIVFRNELTIFSIEGMKEKVNKVFADYKEINIEVKDVVNMDLSFIQLLHSLKLAASESKKKISLKVNISDDLKTLLNNSDLTKVLNN